MNTVERKRVSEKSIGPGAKISSFLGARKWQLAGWTIVLIAAVLRFYRLPLVPLHHDEGVNGSFLTAMFRGATYHYDPANYHGPTLYYMALVTTTLNAVFFGRAGLSTFAIRSVPAIFGTATVWLILQLRRYLGDVGTLVAAVLVAFSPGMIYFSRYFIHEMLLVFFTLGIVVAVLRYYETARARYLMLAAASAAMLFATKETAVLSAITLIVAWILTAAYFRLPERWRGTRGEQDSGKASGLDVPLALRVVGSDRLIFWLCSAATLFAAVYVLLYSSFGANFPKGVVDSFAAFQLWTKTGTSAHTHDRLTCLAWLEKEEWPSLWLGLTGIAVALYRGLRRFVLFAALWSVGILTAYSIVPYKTPWLILNISLPLALVGGYGVGQLWNLAWNPSRTRVRAVLALPLFAICLPSIFHAIDFNFFRYDDDSIPYVYAHTRRGFLDLIRQVDAISTQNGTGTDTGITIASPDHWPLPWYLRDYRRAGYWGKVVPTQEPMVIGESSQEAELQSVLGNRYTRVGSYDLRPGVVLVLYSRSDLSR